MAGKKVTAPSGAAFARNSKRVASKSCVTCAYKEVATYAHEAMDVWANEPRDQRGVVNFKALWRTACEHWPAYGRPYSTFWLHCQRCEMELYEKIQANGGL